MILHAVSKYCRHMSCVRSQIRIAEVFVLVFTLMVLVFDTLPRLQHALPLLLWLPYDPYANSFLYIFTYMFETGCGVIAIVICLSVNMYIYVVLICLSFNYKLLGERARRIGRRSTVDMHRSACASVDVYRDVIDLVRLHLKMNE